MKGIKHSRGRTTSVERLVSTLILTVNFIIDVSISRTLTNLVLNKHRVQKVGHISIFGSDIDSLVFCNIVLEDMIHEAV